MAKKKPYYGKGTKEKVLLDFKFRPSSLAELSRLHGIMGSNTVGDWIKKYGNLYKIDPEKIKQSPSPLSVKEKKDREKKEKRIITKYYYYYYYYSIRVINTFE